MLSEKVSTTAWVTIDSLFECMDGPETVFSMLCRRLECFIKGDGMLLLTQPKARVMLPAIWDEHHTGEYVKVQVTARAVPVVQLEKERNIYGGYLC